MATETLIESQTSHKKLEFGYGDNNSNESNI